MPAHVFVLSIPMIPQLTQGIKDFESAMKALSGIPQALHFLDRCSNWRAWLVLRVIRTDLIASVRMRSIGSPSMPFKRIRGSFGNRMAHPVSHPNWSQIDRWVARLRADPIDPSMSSVYEFNRMSQWRGRLCVLNTFLEIVCCFRAPFHKESETGSNSTTPTGSSVRNSSTHLEINVRVRGVWPTYAIQV